MVTELYDALIAAGAPEEKARAAAQAMSEESLATKADIARLERELSVVKWMTGAIVAGVVSLLLKAFVVKALSVIPAKAGIQSDERVIQVTPIRILFFDQGQFPGPLPLLDLLFSIDSRQHIFMHFIMH